MGVATQPRAHLSQHRDALRGASGPGHYDTRDEMTDPVPDTPTESSSPKRFLFLQRRQSAEVVTGGDAPASSAGPTDAGASPELDARVRPGVLRRRRRALLADYEQGIFDLGGLSMELHRRGLLAEDVMRRRAAEVLDLRQQIDAMATRLDAIREERRDRRQAGRGAGITCPSCGARSRTTANFCASCVAALTPAVEVAVIDAEIDQPTTVIEAEQVTTVIADNDPQHTAAIPPVPRDGS